MSEISDQTGRNSPCPCGSGRKFKNCHGQTGPSSNSTPLAFLAVIGVLALAVVIFAVSSGGSNRESPAPAGAQARVTNYASIPELEAVNLDPTRKAELVRHYNHTSCPCDCNMTVAECRTIDPACSHSKDLLAKELALEEPSQRPAVIPPLPAH